MKVRVITGSGELDLYWNDRPAWLKLVAPRMAAKLRGMSGRELADEWSCLGRDYQRAVWAVLDEATREAIRRARPAAATEREPDLFAAGGVPA